MGIFKKFFSKLSGPRKPGTTIRRSKASSSERISEIENAIEKNKKKNVSPDKERTVLVDIKPVKQHYIIKSAGEYSIYSSINDMPPELRQRVKMAERDEGAFCKYMILEEDEHSSYSSIEELPDEIRNEVGGELE